MTLELNQLTPQVKAMGQSVAGQSTDRRAALQQAKALLKQHSTELAELEARVTQAEKAQTGVRFNWLGAAPAGEPLAGYHPPPPPLTNATVIAADGSQIHPDRHAIALYFLVNVGAIVYRHASGTRPDTITEPRLYYKNKDLFLERGLLVPAGVVNVKRDLAEVDMLARLAPAYGDSPGPVIALIDGQLSLRLIDLPARLQTSCQNHYLKTLDRLRQSEALLAAYIDRPRSSFVLSLLHLAGLKPDAITEETLRRNPFVALTDAELFDDLPPGHRTALFNQRAKANIPYARAGHQIHFFYLNTGPARQPNIVRVEVPLWVAGQPERVNSLHAALLKQTAITGGYPYTLARAHELAIIAPDEREALETMLVVSLRQNGVAASVSLKQAAKNALGSKQPFKL